MWNSKPVGRRCVHNCAIWPDEERYAICPGCRTPTRRIRGLKSVSDPDAERKRCEFEYYYEHEHVRDVEAEIDLPADLAGIF